MGVAVGQMDEKVNNRPNRPTVIRGDQLELLSQIGDPHFIQQRLIAFKCVHCFFLLMKIDASALVPGKVIEARCTKCKAMNYRIGGINDSK